MSFSASDVVFFFGAGASAPFGIPTMKQFVVDFEKFLNKKGSDNEINRYSHIKETLEKLLKRQVDLEAIFTVIDGITNYSLERLGLLSLYSATAYNIPNKADEAICRSLKQKFQTFVREKCLIPKESYGKVSKVYRDFFNRLRSEFDSGAYPPLASKGEFHYSQNWTMFTTNYDTCLEYYWREVVRVPLNTGSNFDKARHTMVLNPQRFYEEGNEMRLLKLHGSVSWFVEKDGTIIEETAMGDSLVGRKYVGQLMIYPIVQKELYVDPYISMFVQLNRELQNKHLWIIVGYSFNDPVIREIFIRNSDERKRIVLLHPEAQRIKEKRLTNIRCKEVFLLNQKFGEEDFLSVNYSLIKQFKTSPTHPPSHIV